MNTKSSNPIFSENVFHRRYAHPVASDTMTVNGSINKTFILFVLLLISAAFTWNYFFFQKIFPLSPGLVITAVIGGLAVAILTVFKKEWSMYTAPLYAIIEGFIIGVISSLFEVAYPGIIIQAVMITFGVFFGMLFLYKNKYIKPTEKFRKGLFAAIIGIMSTYLIGFILSFFNIGFMNIFFGNGLIGIAFSLFVVIIASLTLILDFEFIDKGSNAHLPRYMEWYAAFGLMVTLIWLYIEILRLLSKLRSRN